MAEQQRILTGMRPTGQLHLGALPGRAGELDPDAARVRVLSS